MIYTVTRTDGKQLHVNPDAIAYIETHPDDECDIHINSEVIRVRDAARLVNGIRELRENDDTQKRTLQRTLRDLINAMGRIPTSVRMHF